MRWNLLQTTLRTLLLAALTCATQAAIPENFTLASPVDDSRFALEEARGKMVALHFLLKTECPHCLGHVREYASKAPQVAGVKHVFIKPDAEEEIKGWATKLNSPLSVYRDPDAQWAKAFNIPDGFQFHGESVHYPALVLLDGKGKEIFRHVGKDNSDRLSFAKFAEKVGELTRAGALGEYNLPADRVAIGGYDPVAYQQGGTPAKGLPEIASQYQGATYHFSSSKNRAAFAANPAKFAPTYGGWCATAMAKGKKVEIDPTNFKVTDGRLFLFYSGLFANAQKDWNADEANSIAKADGNWKKISGE